VNSFIFLELQIFYEVMGKAHNVDNCDGLAEPDIGCDFQFCRAVSPPDYCLVAAEVLLTSVTPRAMLAGAQAPSRATHARQVKG